jgi:biotin carboxylase
MRLLILYLGNAENRRAVMSRIAPRLRERGVSAVIADEFVTGEDAQWFDEFVELPPAEEVRAAVRAIEAFARKHPLDGVLAQTEAAVPAAAVACRSLGLRGIPVEAALRCVSKYLSRVSLDEHGVGVPPFELARNAEDVRRFFDKNAGRIVLKGTSSTMGRLVTHVSRSEEIAPAVERMLDGLRTSTDIKRLAELARAAGADLGCDPHREFLVEAFVDGDFLETDGVIEGESVESFGVTEQVMTPPPLFYIQGYLTPADRPPELLERIESVTRAAIAASKLANAGYSIEMRARGDDVRIIEVNGRLGEDDGFMRLFRSADGRDSFWRAAEIALGLDAPPTRSPSVRRAVAYRTSFEEATVVRLPTARELDALRSQGFECGLSVLQDEHMRAPPHPETFPHLAWVYAEDPRSSRAAYERARTAAASLRFELAARSTPAASAE